MNIFKHWITQQSLPAARRDAGAMALVGGMLGAYDLWARILSPEHYLASLALPLFVITVASMMVLWVLRVLARAEADQKPEWTANLLQIASPANRGWFFGVAPLTCAVLLIAFGDLSHRVVGLQWGECLFIGSMIVLIAIMLSLVRTPESSALDHSDSQPVGHGFRTHWLPMSGCVGLTFAVLIGGEAWQTYRTAWSIHTSTDKRSAYGETLDYNDIVQSIPHALVKTRYSRTRREIDIEQGIVEIRSTFDSQFNSAHDPALVVHAGPTTLILGQHPKGEITTTEFEVTREGQHVEVLALAESVALDVSGLRGYPSGWVRRLQILRPYEAAVFEGDTLSVHQMSREEAEDRVAWTMGVLYFRGEPLGEALKLINAYADRALVIEDPRLVSVPVHARFQSDKPYLAERVVARLERQGVLRRVPEGEHFPDNGIRLVDYRADPTRYGPVETQVTQDVCASYAPDKHDRYTYVRIRDFPDGQAQFDIAGCEVGTALKTFTEQSGVETALVTASPHVVTRSIQGNYTAPDALAAMLTGTDCRVSGEVETGLKVTCPMPPASPKG